MSTVGLAEVLAAVLPVEADADGALTVQHGGTVASLRPVTVADDLEMISLTQVLAWDVACNAELRRSVAAHANATMLGTVVLVERPGKRADVMLRYNFPVAGLGESALRTLILMVLDTGAGVRRDLTG